MVIVVTFAANLAVVGGLLAACAYCVIFMGRLLEMCDQEFLPAAYRWLLSCSSYALIEVDLLCVVGLCWLRGGTRVIRPVLRRPHGYEPLLWAVTLALTVVSWLEAGGLLSMWSLAALETLSHATLNVTVALLNPLDLSRWATTGEEQEEEEREEEEEEEAPQPHGGRGALCWRGGLQRMAFYLGLAIPVIHNTFFFFYDSAQAALSVISREEALGSDRERRLLLLLWGAAIWYRGFLAHFFYSKLCNPAADVLKPSYAPASYALSIGQGSRRPSWAGYHHPSTRRHPEGEKEGGGEQEYGALAQSLPRLPLMSSTGPSNTAHVI